MRQFLIDRIRAFYHAFNGLTNLFGNHTHAKIHLFFVLLVSSAGFYFDIQIVEWSLVFICFGLVIGAEAINTALECLCDKLNPEIDPQIAKVKDIAAAAVLVVSICAFGVGWIIFFPKIISCLGF